MYILYNRMKIKYVYEYFGIIYVVYVYVYIYKVCRLEVIIEMIMYFRNWVNGGKFFIVFFF